MGKVKVTQEQADKLRMIDDILKSEFISIHKLKESLTYGYEVEPQFKVGDWIVAKYEHDDKHWTHTAKIKGWIGDVVGGSFFLDKAHIGASEENARHATPEEIQQEKQRRWWKKHDREVYQFKVNDLITMEDHAVFERIHKVTNDYIETIYGRYFKEEYKNIKVSCFVEDRKDIKENE